jgi:hypothetical protein
MFAFPDSSIGFRHNFIFLASCMGILTQREYYKLSCSRQIADVLFHSIPISSKVLEERRLYD